MHTACAFNYCIDVVVSFVALLRADAAKGAVSQMANMYIAVPANNAHVATIVTRSHMVRMLRFIQQQHRHAIPMYGCFFLNI